MSDFLFVVLPHVELEATAEQELEAFVKRQCTGLVPHNHLCHFRVDLYASRDESSFEPHIPGGITEPLLESILEWAQKYTSSVLVRMEGHRGKKPLPPLESRSGTIADVLSFKRPARRAYNVEFVVSSPESA